MLANSDDLKKSNWQSPHHHWAWWLYAYHSSQLHSSKLVCSYSFSSLLFDSLFSGSSAFFFSLFAFYVTLDKTQIKNYCRFGCIHTATDFFITAVTVGTMATTPHKCKGKDGKTCNLFFPVPVGEY